MFRLFAIGLAAAISFGSAAAQSSTVRELARQAVLESPADVDHAAAIARGLERGLAAAKVTMTPYARQRLQAASTAAMADVKPAMMEAVAERRAAEFSETELREMIAFQRHPLARKIVQFRGILASSKSDEQKAAEIEAMLTREESEELHRLMENPAVADRGERAGAITVEVVNRFMPQIEARMNVRMQAACRGASEPLPWCAGR